MGPKYWGTVRKCKNCLLSGPKDLTATPAFKAPRRRREAAVAASYGQQSTCTFQYPHAVRSNTAAMRSSRDGAGVRKHTL